MFDFVRISCCVPKLSVGNTQKNADDIIEKIYKAEQAGANFILFPELCITGYTCDDLFFQECLRAGTRQALLRILDATKDCNAVTIVGAPLMLYGQLYNCAVILTKGKICGIVPKSFLADYNEFHETRWFSAAESLSETMITFDNVFPGATETYEIALGSIVFQTENHVPFGVEICEDLWMPVPPSTQLVSAGAALIFNISASNEIVGKRTYRQDMARLQSSKSCCAYAYVSCGTDESTTDLIFSGHSMVAENGTIIAENQEFLASDYIMTMDVDLGKIYNDRLRYKTRAFREQCVYERQCKRVTVSVQTASDGSLYAVRRHPFIPAERNARITRCLNIFAMQTAALKKRLQVTGGKAVIGVSGGLDSTLALLVTRAAVEQMGLSPENICAVTMPCFGTTDRTYQNAVSLMNALGVTAKNISIKEACMVHFQDIGHDMAVHDVTFENVQARERTQVLMDLSNQFGGIVIGTGDLSELALGWCTYCGDQMSMYGVNSGIPKTLVRFMVESLVEHNVFPAATHILRDVLDTPISPELLPPNDAGDIAQKTEDLVGPYELHDFFLYYVLRYGYTPAKVYHLAKQAFCGEYENGVILKWLKQFYKRFFTQQFKRSCMPDGVKIGSVGLSPRGDFKMPSDAENRLWLAEVEELCE